MALFGPANPSPYQVQPAMMNYPNYGIPQTSQPQIPTPQSQQNNQQSNVLWVQGESAAKSYPVGPGNTAIMMDSEEPVFYIKTVDMSGMPQPLRVFDFTERIGGTKHSHEIDTDEFITRDEFEERIAELKRVEKERSHETKKRQSLV